MQKTIHRNLPFMEGNLLAVLKFVAIKAEYLNPLSNTTQENRGVCTSLI